MRQVQNMRSCKLNHDSKLKLNADNFGFICPGFDIFAPTFYTNEVNGIRFVVLAALKKSYSKNSTAAPSNRSSTEL